MYLYWPYVDRHANVIFFYNSDLNILKFTPKMGKSRENKMCVGKSEIDLFVWSGLKLVWIIWCVCVHVPGFVCLFVCYVPVSETTQKNEVYALFSFLPVNFKFGRKTTLWKDCLDTKENIDWKLNNIEPFYFDQGEMCSGSGLKQFSCL